ncbi:MAG: hypothetical protein ACLFV4_06225 [Candidatus Hydrogenedentota bacterium]
MTKRIRYFLPFALMLLLGFGLVGCEAEEEEPEEEEPPPPSAGEIERAFVETYEGLPDEIGDEQMEETLNEVRETRGEYQATENWAEGRRRAIEEFEDMARRADDRELWTWLIFADEALKTLDPDHSRFDRLRERAEIQLRRPEVEITGFYEDHDTGQETVFMNVYLPEEDREERVQVRPGEEFHGLRLRDIIGRNRGVELEYLEANEIFEVMHRE